MPRGPALTLTASVVPSSAPRLELTADVRAPDAPRLVLEGTVSRRLIRAFDGDSIQVGARLKLAGEWVDEAELAGPVSWRCSLDSHRKSAQVTLRGKAWSVWQTLRTWTIVPAELWIRQGPPGEVEERLELRGWVRPGSSQTGGIDPAVQIEIDNSIPFDTRQLCAEIPPYSGFTRGEILRQLAASVGITKTRIPDGEPYDKPLFAGGKTFFAFAKDFAEATGWHLRLVPDPDGESLILEAITAEAKDPPVPPDRVWRIDDCERIDVEAPRAPLSRILVRGVAAVSVDEVGITTEIERTEIEGVYLPADAVEEQLPDGSIRAVSGGGAERFGLVRILESEIKTRGGREISSTAREYSRRNPRAARLRTPRAGESDGPADGYHFTRAWIDPEGEYRFWRNARLVLSSERRLVSTWDESTGDLLRTTIEEDGWRGIPAGVKNAVSGSWIVGVGVGSDDQSYAQAVGLSAAADRYPIEGYGRTSRHETHFTPDPETGVVVAETLRSFAHHPRRAALDVLGHALRYDGTAQELPIAPWRLVREVHVVHQITSDKRLAGTLETERGWRLLLKLDGAHDFGAGESSDRVSETFLPVASKAVSYRRRADGTVEETVFEAGQAPNTRILTADPLPRFRASIWTLLRQEPVEAVVEDPTLEALFGRRTKAISSDHLTSQGQALALAREIRRRTAARRVTVTRPETRCEPGETIRLIDPHQGLDHRARLVEIEATRDGGRGTATATYRLEVDL